MVLVWLRLMVKTQQGRQITKLGLQHLGRELPPTDSSRPDKRQQFFHATEIGEKREISAIVGRKNH